MSIWNSYKFDLPSKTPEQVIEHFKAILQSLNIQKPLEIIFDTPTQQGLLDAQQLFGEQLLQTPVDIGGRGRSENYLAIIESCLPYLSQIKNPRTSFNLTFFTINKDYTLSTGFLHNEYWTPSIYLSFLEYGERTKFRSIRNLQPKYYQQELERLNLSEDFYQTILDINNESICNFYKKCMAAMDIPIQFSIDERDKLVFDKQQISKDYVARKLGFSSFHLIPNSKSVKDAMQLLSQLLNRIDLLVSEYRFAFSTSYQDALKIAQVPALFHDEVSFRNANILQCDSQMLEHFKNKRLPGTMTVTVPFTPPELLDEEDAMSEISLFLSPDMAEIEVDISSSEHYPLIVEYLQLQTERGLNWFAAL